MTITIWGYIFIPLILISTLNFRYLLGLFIISLSLQMTSIINIDNFHYGLRLYRFIAIVLDFVCLFYFVSKKNNIVFAVKKMLIALTLFIVYGFLISFWGPIMFEGCLVFVPEYGIDYNAVYGPFPLKFSLYNLILPVNIFIFVLVFVFIVLFEMKEKCINFVIKCFYFTIIMILFFSFYQLLQSIVYLPNIFKIINNTISNQFHLVSINLSGINFLRVAATYSEPSYLSSFLVSIFSFAFSSFILYKKLLWLLILVSILILLSASSTTYLCSLIMIFVVLMFAWFTCFRKKEKLLRSFIILLLCLTAIFIFVSYIIGLNNMMIILNDFLFNKMYSYSFINRIKADIYSFFIFSDSFGLGMGIGSTRPSSLLPCLISTVGVWGTFFFLLFLYYFLRYSYYSLKTSAYFPYFFLVPSVIVTQLVAYPDFTNPTLWQMLYIVLIIIKKIRFKYYYGLH
ncbi:hypothetical protein SAMN04488516_102342 [Desulfonauticus submarinus]|uniref:O-antigen ligase like membrane protein n=1 Tax=Desulfonauticus submarinus TaxID=206665 RepID=A0A1H0BYN0_9BACT|nr:hypothetical protein [Desulfonauticus submarinus]SDN50798.1 hypothetical protein SAMN04488516_102342 [Desulfonauticus submarinus]